MEQVRPTVSRIQCKVHVLADGGAAVVSAGRGPTLWRTPGGAWNGLYEGQHQTLVDGMQVSLDWHDPEAAVFSCSCRVEDATQQGYDLLGYPPQQGHQGGGYPTQGGY